MQSHIASAATKEEEWKEQEDNIEIEEKDMEEVKEENKEKDQKSEEFPDVDIGIDIFSQQ